MDGTRQPAIIIVQCIDDGDNFPMKKKWKLKNVASLDKVREILVYVFLSGGQWCVLCLQVMAV